MTAYGGRRDFRSGWVVRVATALATALFSAGASVTYRDRGWTWVSVGLALMALGGVGGIVESFILRVQLTDDALLVRDLRGRRGYPRREIVAVQEAKGVPTAIRLVDGSWVRLPSVGSSMGNSIRAWLKTP